MLTIVLGLLLFPVPGSPAARVARGGGGTQRPTQSEYSLARAEIGTGSLSAPRSAATPLAPGSSPSPTATPRPEIQALPWFDDGETGAGGWSADPPWALVADSVTDPAHSGRFAWSDSPGGPFGNDVTAALTTPPLDVRAVNGSQVALSYWLQYSLGQSRLKVEYRFDKGDWQEVETYFGANDGYNLYRHPFPVPAGARVLTLRFLLESNFGGEPRDDGAHLDDVHVEVDRSIVTNGGFESPSVDYATFYEGERIDGWIVQAGSVDLQGDYWQNAGGQQSLDLAGVEPGAIAQELLTLPGKSYLLRFAMSGNPEGGPRERTMEIWWGSRLVDTPSHDMSGHYASEMDWEYHEYLLVAMDTTTRLRFEQVTVTAYGVALDNVQVIPVEGVTPTPTSTLPPGPSPTPGVTPTASPRVELAGQLGGKMQAVAVGGNFAYVGVGSRLQILDISDPAHPIEVGSAPLQAGATGIVVVRHDDRPGKLYAYVAAKGLYIFDVTNPSRPRRVGFHGASASEVEVAGDYAYVGEDAGLRIINVREPARPLGVGFYEAYGSVRGIAVRSQYVYVAQGNENAKRGPSMVVLDVSVPARPEIVWQASDGGGEDLALSGNYLYLAGYAGLDIFEVSTPATPREASHYDTPSQAEDVVVVGSYAYVTTPGNPYYPNPNDGVRILDVSVPANPAAVGFYNVPALEDLAAGNGYAFVVSWERGLQILDLSSPPNPTAVASYRTIGDTIDVVMKGRYAYVADLHGGLAIVDVSNPARPRLAGFHDTPGRAVAVAVEGSYAYFGALEAGLRIIDVSNPASPSEIGSYDTPGDAGRVVVTRGRAYVVDVREAGNVLRILDVSTPASPRELGVYTVPLGVTDVAVGGNYAYVAEDARWEGAQPFVRLHVVDVSNPARPHEVGFYDTLGSLHASVTLAGNYVYLASSGAGVEIVSVAVPSHPTRVGLYPSESTGGNAAVFGRYAYVDLGYEGLRILDVADPASPVEVGSYDTAALVLDVAVSGSYTYVADGPGGLVILRFNAPYPSLGRSLYLPVSIRSP